MAQSPRGFVAARTAGVSSCRRIRSRSSCRIHQLDYLAVSEVMMQFPEWPIKIVICVLAILLVSVPVEVWFAAIVLLGCPDADTAWSLVAALTGVLSITLMIPWTLLLVRVIDA